MERRTLTIEKTVYGGYGMGFSGKYTVFVPYTLPGETVSVTPYKKQKNILFASVTEIHISASSRIQPECPHFTRCGGCQFQHCTYQTERSEKRGQIIDQLRRIAKTGTPPDIQTIHADRYNYRSIAGIKYNNRHYGFYQNRSHTVIPFPHEGCMLLTNALRTYIQESSLPKRDFRISADIYDRCYVQPHDRIIHNEYGYTYIRENNSFFQSNALLRTRMITEVMNLLKTEEYDICIDAGCGCGFFTLPLSERASHVYGFDTDKHAIHAARENAVYNRISNTTFIHGSFDEIQLSDVDLILADPPRSGLSKQCIQSLLLSGIGTIIYISCDPSSWARDIKYLSSHYYPEQILHIDMFPATSHIELISLLKRI